MRGLNEKEKRQSIFRWLKSQNHDVIFFKKLTVVKRMNLYGIKNGKMNAYTHMEPITAAV